MIVVLSIVSISNYLLSCSLLILTCRFFSHSISLGIQQIAATVKSQIEDFRPSIPLIQALRAPGMRNRHWEEVC